MKRSICVMCKDCGKKKYITEKNEGDFNRPIFYFCSNCKRTYSNIMIDEIFHHDIGEMKLSHRSMRISNWALAGFIYGVIRCFFNIMEGLSIILVAIVLFIIGMILEYRQQ